MTTVGYIGISLACALLAIVGHFISRQKGMQTVAIFVAMLVSVWTFVTIVVLLDLMMTPQLIMRLSPIETFIYRSPLLPLMGGIATCALTLTFYLQSLREGKRNGKS